MPSTTQGAAPDLVDYLIRLPALLVLRGGLGEIAVEVSDAAHDRRVHVSAVVAGKVVGKPKMTQRSFVAVKFGLVEVGLIADAHVDTEVPLAESVARVVPVGLKYAEA